MGRDPLSVVVPGRLWNSQGNRETYRQVPYKTLSFMATATPPVGIWERGQGHDGPPERARAYARFRAWLELGHERNLASFAAAQGISRQALYETARRYNWRERALAWDRAEAAAGRCPPPPVPPQFHPRHGSQYAGRSHQRSRLARPQMRPLIRLGAWAGKGA